jgi:acetolactate synthase regulatory subunit
MHVRSAATPNAAKVRVVVTDAVGLQRVLTMLAGRQHPFTRLEAEEAGGGRWSIDLDLVAQPGQIELVTARLHRLPSVLTVDVAWAQPLATTA